MSCIHTILTAMRPELTYSVADLATMTRIDEKTVAYALRQLEKGGGSGFGYGE